MIEEIRAEIAGTVLEVVVAEGREVGAGGTVLVLESMKMEIPVLSEWGGRLVRLPVSVGTAVGEGDLLAAVER